MKPSLSKREINRQRWLERITDWQQCGHSQKAYCEQHHLGLASFQRWRRIFMTQEKSKDMPAVAFLPVNLVEPSAPSLTVQVNDNLRLEISAGFDPTTLKRVIQILQAS
jgi:hypothetical protein